MRKIALIAGAGEVGLALGEALRGAHQVEFVDPLKGRKYFGGLADVLNVCFPYSDEFLNQVRGYQYLYSPALTIIHSTVPIGTSRQLYAVHSPVIGQHPELARCIKTFGKPVGPMNRGQWEAAALFLARAGITPIQFNSPETTEAAKLFSTLRLGLDVKFEKQVHEFCQQSALSFFDVYIAWTAIYNAGYSALMKNQFQRPMIQHMPGPIGGHCIIPNAQMLADVFPPARELVEFNSKEEAQK